MQDPPVGPLKGKCKRICPCCVTRPASSPSWPMPPQEQGCQEILSSFISQIQVLRISVFKVLILNDIYVCQELGSCACNAPRCQKRASEPIELVVVN